MRITYILLLALLLQTPVVNGQNDQEAIKILDKFSSRALAAPSVSMKFNLINTDLKENISDTISGSIILSKDKYYLDLQSNMIWFNGETSWSYLPAEKEVTVNNADRKDNSFQNRPSTIFSMYKKGYKNRLVEERPHSYILDMYPEEINSELQRVRLTIGKSLLDLKTLEYKRKDGVTVTLSVLQYDLSQRPDPDRFVFKQENYKGVEVIDMR
jgi:outer membrane lipoprotein-sorting protein